MAALDVAPVAGPRSPGLSYQGLLDTDSREVPEVLRWESARELPIVEVPRERYFSREFAELEREKLWKKVWQMACREEEIPEVGDHIVYEIAGLSAIVVRCSETEIKAFYNTCLHRGRQLRDCDGRVGDFRCPFHGWTWDLGGQLKHVPGRWDFPQVERGKFALPELKVGTWGGFVFVNFDSECESLESFLGDLGKHFEPWPLEDRYIEAHVGKVLGCNWKVAQEAFMEAYHVVATHPQLLAGIGDGNSQYDVWDNFSRAITANMTPSPNINWEPTEQDMLDTMSGRSIDQMPMMQVAEGMTARKTLAQAARIGLQGTVASVGDISDAELNDSFYYTVFPNFHPWGAYNKIIYRFRPHGDPDHCLMEVYYIAPFRGRRPKPAPLHLLGDDEDWTKAPELGFLTKVFNQDTFNLPNVQKGLKQSGRPTVQFAQYQESKLRHFHVLLEKQLAKG